MLFTCSLLWAQEGQPELTKVGTYKCGRQPKQVLFSPDSKYIIMPLLDDKGFDIFSIEDKKIIKRINPPDAAKLGFAEGLFIPEKKVFFVSQMTTANIYEYSYPGFELKRTIPTGGNWSKFIAFSSERQLFNGVQPFIFGQAVLRNRFVLVGEDELVQSVKGERVAVGPTRGLYVFQEPLVVCDEPAAFKTTGTVFHIFLSWCRLPFVANFYSCRH